MKADIIPQKVCSTKKAKKRKRVDDNEQSSRNDELGKKKGNGKWLCSRVALEIPPTHLPRSQRGFRRDEIMVSTFSSVLPEPIPVEFGFRWLVTVTKLKTGNSPRRGDGEMVYSVKPGSKTRPTPKKVFFKGVLRDQPKSWIFRTPFDRNANI